MNKKAIIINGVVDNIILWDGVTTYTPPECDEVVDVTSIFCGIGYTYENGAFIPPQTVEE